MGSELCDGYRHHAVVGRDHRKFSKTAVPWDPG
jgi:hypothetical protein